MTAPPAAQMTGCPICSQPVTPNRIGRPKTFCSVECRREARRLRDDLVALSAELIDARGKAWGFWPGPVHWEQEVDRLELAIAEMRMRLPGSLETLETVTSVDPSKPASRHVRVWDLSEKQELQTDD